MKTTKTLKSVDNADRMAVRLIPFSRPLTESLNRRVKRDVRVLPSRTSLSDDPKGSIGVCLSLHITPCLGFSRWVSFEPEETVVKDPGVH